MFIENRMDHWFGCGASRPHINGSVVLVLNIMDPMRVPRCIIIRILLYSQYHYFYISESEYIINLIIFGLLYFKHITTSSKFLMCYGWYLYLRLVQFAVYCVVCQNGTDGNSPKLVSITTGKSP